MALAFRSQGQAPHTAPVSTRKRQRQLNERPFSGNRAYRWRRRCQRANENLGTFSFQRQPAGRRPPASLSSFHDAEIKAQASRELISSGAAFSRKRPATPS
jgi:hypothetical protein